MPTEAQLEALRREQAAFRVTVGRIAGWLAVLFASIIASALWPGVWGVV